MIDYNKLGKHIDNVYTGALANSSRKVVTKLSGNILTLEFRSIVNVDRGSGDLKDEQKKLEAEAIKLIGDKQKEIVSNYNSEADYKIKLKETNKSKVDNCSFELLTFSPISPVRTYKFSCCKCFELS